MEALFIHLLELHLRELLIQASELLLRLSLHLSLSRHTIAKNNKCNAGDTVAHLILPCTIQQRRTIAENVAFERQSQQKGQLGGRKRTKSSETSASSRFLSSSCACNVETCAKQHCDEAERSDYGTAAAVH